MANIIIAFDEDDIKAGSYYKGCADHLRALITSPCHITSISKKKLNCAFIDLILADLSDKSFLFFAYSHGGEDKLSCDTGYYLSSSSNLTSFSNSFFYSYACLAGKKFGEDLITNGCITFFGYTKTIYHYSAHEHLFIECANYGIAMMLQGDEAGTAEQKMKDKYEAEADRLSGYIDLVAAELIDTRDALTVLGRKNFKLIELGYNHL